MVIFFLSRINLTKYFYLSFFYANKKIKLCVKSMFLKILQTRKGLGSYLNLKGQCHEIFWHFLFHESKPSGPLINRLKWFCLKVCFCREIHKNSTPRSVACAVSDSAQANTVRSWTLRRANTARSWTLRRLTLRGVEN